MPFQAADPQKLRRLLAGAGLVDVRVEETAWTFEVGSGDDLWTLVTGSNPLGAQMVAGLTARQKAAVVRELDDLLAHRARDNGPAVLTSAVNVGVGTCPAGG